MKWTKKAAINELNKLIEEIEGIKKVKAFSSDHVYWHQRVVSFFEEIFGKDSRLFRSFAYLTWKRGGSFFVDDPSDIDREHHKAFIEQLDTAKGLLLAAKDELRKKDLEEVYKGKDTGPEVSLILKIINLGEYKLRKVIRKIPEKEREVQDAFESLLVGAEITFSRETDSIEYSLKTYTPDFSISRAGLAIEIKLCSDRKNREKEIIAEINDDILAYKTKYGNLFFIIYDLGIIRDIDRFVKNFEDQEGIVVKVVKH